MLLEELSKGCGSFQLGWLGYRRTLKAFISILKILQNSIFYTRIKTSLT